MLHLNIEGLKILKPDSVNARNRTVMLIVALAFMVINTIIVILVCNTKFISEYDKIIWNTKMVLITNGICFGGFFLALKFLKSLTVKKLFLMFLIIRLVILYFFIVFNYGVQNIDFGFYSSIPPRILNGEIFTPYTGLWEYDTWRLYPPMFIWWYTYNYLIYGLNETLWRFVNLLLEVGIVYVMIQIFHENSATEKGWTTENFKIGLSFYIFALTPIVAILLYANMIAFPVLLALLGFLYFFRSKRNPKYLYYAVFFLCLVFLTEGFAAFWMLGILFIELLKKNFRRLFLLAAEILALSFLFTLPFLINDAIGYVQKILANTHLMTSVNWDGTIWAINWKVFSVNFIPVLFAFILTLYYIYKSYRFEISLDFFIVITSIFLFFSPAFSPWHYLWLFPLICLNLIYSFRKFLISNLFFVGYFVLFVIWFATAYLSYSGMIFPDVWATYVQIFSWMSPAGYFAALPLIIQIVFQMGFIFLIFSYTKSKTLILALLIAFSIGYILNICNPGNLIY